MSRIIIFRRLPCGNFESYEQGTNGWNYFAARQPEVPAVNGESTEILFSAYVEALRANQNFNTGLPASIGIRQLRITADTNTGRVAVEDGDSIVAKVGQYYVLECREIFVPYKVKLERRIKSLGRDYCYTYFCNDANKEAAYD